MRQDAAYIRWFADIGSEDIALVGGRTHQSARCTAN